MEVRKDLESVAPYISRLLSIGAEFSRNDANWSHLKNNEDFRFISRIPYEKQHKVEAVYADGRDMALYMRDALLSINYDFGRYPTLTSIINRFQGGWVYGCYNSKVADVAQEICAEHDVNLWSVGQMVSIFKKQEELLAAVRVTLNMLKESDLYKMENGLPVMKQEPNISVNGNHGASININSPGATATVSTNYNEPAIFSEMLAVVRSQGFDGQVESMLADNVLTLAASHRNGGFKEAYKDFMQNVSAHITVFTPFVSGLSSLL